MANVKGTSGSETLRGTLASDVIDGQGGNDTLYGLGGNDTLIGGAGNDHIYGGDGDDWIRAVVGDGSDRIHGDRGADFIELTVGDVIIYTSYQQSGAGFGVDRVHTQRRADPWTIDFSQFDANLLVAGIQKLRFDPNDQTPEIGELSILRTNNFLRIPVGLIANLDADPQPEFQVNFGWEYQVTPTLFFG